jgi:type IV secretory pathway TrbD component
MSTTNLPSYRPAYRSLHRPLTIAGVDRRLFFLALLAGAATFNLFYSFLAGCLLSALIYAVAWVSTARDPHMLQILLRSGHARARYDAAKHVPFELRIR